MFTHTGVVQHTIHTLASQYVSDFLSTRLLLNLPTNNTLSTSHEPLLSQRASHLRTGRKRRRDDYVHHPYKLYHMNTVKSVIRAAWKPSTQKKYSSAVRQFVDYCHINAIPTDEILPAPESLLCEFAASFAGRVAGKTVSAKCDGIRAWHIENGYAYHGGQQLEYVIKGVENHRPLSSFRPKRPPVSNDMLICLEKNLDSSSPSDRCIYFVALACFWGQIRLGEILPLSERKFNLSLYPTWDDLKPPATLAGSRTLHLPNTKMGGRHGEDIILTKQDLIDPINALHLHHSINFASNSQPIASYRNSSGGLTILTQRKFLSCINFIFRQNNLYIISGHCFRIGGTTHLLLAGISPDIVKILGRWSSDAFLRYWCHLEIIAPLHIEFLRPILQEAGLLRRIAS